MSQFAATFQFITFLLVIQWAFPLSLMERHKEKLENPKQRLHNLLAPVLQDNTIGADLKRKIGHKSITRVGSFRGRPILSRQNSVYIDGNGDALSILPYNEASQRIHSRLNLSG